MRCYIGNVDLQRRFCRKCEITVLSPLHVKREFGIIDSLPFYRLSETSEISMEVESQPEVIENKKYSLSGRMRR